jgi:hypothetical protein
MKNSQNTLNPNLVKEASLFLQSDNERNTELLYRISYVFKDINQKYDEIFNDYSEYPTLIETFKQTFSELFAKRKMELVTKETLQWKEVAEMDNFFVNTLWCFINSVIDSQKGNK